NRGGNRSVDASVLDAMRFILREDVKRIFSFSINEASMKKLSQIANDFLRVHFDRTFKTDIFYKGLI
ncbi:MAG: DNA repair protein RecO C-terminal domain-containing protein, partial [Oscillospiraceae bacterium]|nr:DNA repair protein RecO C-terminal domain-containing protein [Oscillospiraceae bacterium]